MGDGRPHASGDLGVAALASIGIGGMVGGGIFSVLGLTVELAGAGADVSFVVGGPSGHPPAGRMRCCRRVPGPRRTGHVPGPGVRDVARSPAEPAAVAELLRDAGAVRVAFGSYLAGLLGLPAERGGVGCSAAWSCLSSPGSTSPGPLGPCRGPAGLLQTRCAAGVLRGWIGVYRHRPCCTGGVPVSGRDRLRRRADLPRRPGFQLIANASEDARDPQRTLPRAYLISTGA